MTVLTTTRRALPYPDSAENVDVPGDIGALAGALDNDIRGFEGLESARAGFTPSLGGGWKPQDRWISTDTGVEWARVGSALVALNPKDAAANVASLRTLGNGPTQAMPGNAVMTAAQIADDAVGNAELADGAVTTANVQDRQVTGRKLAVSAGFDSAVVADENPVVDGSGSIKADRALTLAVDSIVLISARFYAIGSGAYDFRWSIELDGAAVAEVRANGNGGNANVDGGTHSVVYAAAVAAGAHNVKVRQYFTGSLSRYEGRYWSLALGA